MKIQALIVSLALLFSYFCLPLQQSFAQTNADLMDSQVFFEKVAQRPKYKNFEPQIEALLKKMTVEEKVGQMTELEIGVITNGFGNTVQIDPAKLEKAIVQYKVGSILNVPGHALTVDKWWEIVGAIQAASAKTRLKIPNIYGVDSIHGANYVQGATLFPQEIAMAATWNPYLMQKSQEITAMETRAAALPWAYSPNLDLGRQPTWGRYWETYGEDPYLAKVMGTAFVRGLEGTDVANDKHVASCPKHYLAYSFPFSGRDRTNAILSETELREYYLPPYEAAFKAGARTVMVNSAAINGIPGHINKHLLTDVLKGELGFDGFIVSDWQDIQKLVTQWKVAKDEKEATMIAINAGIDMSMVPQSYTFSDNLIELVKEKKVPMTRIDDAVRRILRVKFQLGLFENPMPNPSVKNNFGKPEYAQVSLEAARESLVLLKNDSNILPLAKNKKVLVTGPTADSLISLNNGWTWVWQGSEKSLYPKDKLTIQQAIKAKLGGNVQFVQGTEITLPPGKTAFEGTPAMFDREVDVDKAVEAAKKSDVVVLCLGEGSYAETPGNMTDLTLPEIQLKFAEKIIATGKPVVLVMVEGRPRIINRIADKVSGILLAMNPSDMGGVAIADVLFGDYNPNGKLPLTYPRHPHNYLMYDYRTFEVEETSYGNSATTPQFYFGDGLSYTTFAYSDLKLSSKSIPMTGEITVSFKITNTGKRAGKETAILYLRDEVASVAPPGKRVKRFAKISLNAGESKTITFKLNKDDLSFIGANNKPIVEAGDFTVMVGSLKDTFTVK